MQRGARAARAYRAPAPLLLYPGASPPDPLHALSRAASPARFRSRGSLRCARSRLFTRRGPRPRTPYTLSREPLAGSLPFAWLASLRSLAALYSSGASPPDPLHALSRAASPARFRLAWLASLRSLASCDASPRRLAWLASLRSLAALLLVGGFAPGPPTRSLASRFAGSLPPPLKLRRDTLRQERARATTASAERAPRSVATQLRVCSSLPPPRPLAQKPAPQPPPPPC